MKLEISYEKRKNYIDLYRQEKRSAVGPALIQGPLVDTIKVDIYWKWMDLFVIPASVRKEIYGAGRFKCLIAILKNIVLLP